ncbi:hypothetical protein IJ541_03730 [bacterium]|nr:hypothetical protein [bacterium]
MAGFHVGTDSIVGGSSGIPFGTNLNVPADKDKLKKIILQFKQKQLKPAQISSEQNASVSAYSKLSKKELEQYQYLTQAANSKSYNTVIDKVQAWNKAHPDLKIVSQYGI